MKTKYYESYPVADGYRGRIYQYKDNGNNTDVIWNSPEAYPTPEQAEDAAVDWAEAHDLVVELG